MTLTHIANLLDPLQSAIVMQSWEDAEDIAQEISRLCRLKRLSELQTIQEAIEDRNQTKTAPGGSQVAKQPAVAFRSEPEITLETRFDSIGHDEPWKNSLANDLNLLLHYAGASNLSFIPLACSIAKRVAQFEEIKVDTRAHH